MNEWRGAVPPQVSRPLPSRLAIFSVGAVMGLVGFMVAKALVPAMYTNFPEHQFFLVRNIGFVFPALAGFSIGLIQGSLARMLWGMISGSAIGFLYSALCASNFRIETVQFAFPAFCGGLMAALMGVDKLPSYSGPGWRFTKDDEQRTRLAFEQVSLALGWRFIRGLIAGVVCGGVDLVVANFLLNNVFYSNYDYVMDWKVGSIALATASGCFMIVFCWAIGLKQQGNPNRKIAT